MFSVLDIILISQTYRYCNVASFAIAVTDYFICLPQEVELIWPTRWSAGKILYILTRYSAFTDSVLNLYLASPNHSTSSCQRIFTASAWLVIFGMFFSETVLVFRTWAVWERNLKLFIILLIILLSGVIVSLVFARISLARVAFGTTAEGYPPGCWLVSFVNPIIIIGYIVILSFETTILVLTLYKCRQAIITRRSKLLVTLHRDAILYCFFIAVWSLANIINQVIPSANAPSFEELQRVIHSVLTARILLNLRQAVHASLEAKLSSQSTLSLSWEPSAVAGINANSANHDQERTQGGDGASSSVIQERNSTQFNKKRNATSESRSKSRLTFIRRYQWNVTGTSSGSGSGSNSSQLAGNTSIISNGLVRRYLSMVLDLDEESWAHDEESARWTENEDPELSIETTAPPPPNGSEGSLGEGPNGSGRGSGNRATEVDVQIV